jgi:hypothetical protein
LPRRMISIRSLRWSIVFLRFSGNRRRREV